MSKKKRKNSSPCSWLWKRSAYKSDKQIALDKKDAEIKSKQKVIQCAIANKFTTSLKRKYKELEDLKKEREQILRS